VSDLPPGWTRRSVESLCETVTSGGTPSRRNPAFYLNGTINWFKTGELRDRTLDESEEKITLQALDDSSAKVFPVDTVLLALYGDGDTITSLGILRSPAATNQACCAMIVDKALADPRFLFYALKHTREDLLRVVVGGAQRNLNGKLVREHQISVPNLDQQKAIAAVLGALDDKIEQNRRTGRALEGLARATFKAWFVDFEPVKAKAAGTAGFPGLSSDAFAALPDRLSDSPLGPVPQGWDVSNIGIVAQRIAMGPFGSDIKTDNFVSDGVPVIRGGNLTEGFVDRDFVFLTEAKADQLANANAFPGDIVITHRGTLGQVGLIPRKSRYERYVVSQSQMLIRPNAAMLKSQFLYRFLTSSAGQHELLANRSQTGVPAISRPTTSLKAIPLVVPQGPIAEAFERFASTLFNVRVAGEDESQKLAALRDYLLPRLLSGRVTVRSPQQ
jgi:type I restriction enzyme S subunit